MRLQDVCGGNCCLISIVSYKFYNVERFGQFGMSYFSELYVAYFKLVILAVI